MLMPVADYDDGATPYFLFTIIFVPFFIDAFRWHAVIRCYYIIFH